MSQPSVSSPQSVQAELAMFCRGLDEASAPIVVLASDGLILHANAAAQKVLREDMILVIKSGRLLTRRKEETEALARATAQAACAGFNPQLMQWVRLSNREGRVIIVLSFQRIDLPKMAAVVLVRVAHLRFWSVPALAWLAGTFGLTKAEAGVAASIFAGHDLLATAAARQCSLETVRTLLKRTMRKLGVRTQAQMQRMLQCALVAAEPVSNEIVKTTSLF